MIWVVVIGIWVISLFCAMAMTVVQAEKACNLTGMELPKRWWLAALAYVVYVAIICTALTLFILNHAGIL